MSINAKMTALADEIRELLGTTEAMGLDAMTANVGDANAEIEDQTDIIAQIVNALEDKATGGIELPELDNPCITDDVLSGKEFISEEGNVEIGTMPNNGNISSIIDGINIKNVTVPAGYTSGGIVSIDDTIDNEVNSQHDIIIQIKNMLKNKASAKLVISSISNAYVDGERLVL